MSSARSRWSTFLPAAGLAVLGAAFLPVRPAIDTVEAAQANQRSLTVAILDKSHAPVTTVTAADLVVREDGVAREIVRVTPAPPPTEIVLLIDDSQAAERAVRDLREALTTFVQTMADLTPPPAIRLATFGDRPTVAVDFNPTFSAVSRGIDRLFSRPGAGAQFLESINDTTDALRRRKAQRPVIVGFVIEAGPEFGNYTHSQIRDMLRGANASLWTLVLTVPGGGPSSDAARERDMVLGDVTRESGGHNEEVLAIQNLPEAFTKLASQLTSRWEVTYGRPDTLVPPSRLEVEARSTDMRVLAPQWVTR
jgi:hypothetical protein